ncbi:DegT/DnrJ/EryC1/StrS family aminotransferase [Streptomyces sp. URMC 123]|uniref:DegT/DnrJ/EryC1/StrS family aminotransferase n=1 Tax=Streptomyces sp. URMC 123 TaxID=3423403 RepID=UPI003F1C8FD2
MGNPVDGLLHTLRTSGLGAGDEVIVPSYGPLEVPASVRLIGARPVFADIAADTYCLDPAAVAAAVTSRTAAVVLAHQFGNRAAHQDIGELTAGKGLLLVPYEESPQPEFETALRQDNAAYLTQRLAHLGTPRVRPGALHTFARYVVRVPGNGRPDRDAFARTLRAKGVPCQVPVSTPAHRLPAFRWDGRLPQTERAADECLALPVDPALSRRELQRVASTCNALGGLLQPAL